MIKKTFFASAKLRLGGLAFFGILGSSLVWAQPNAEEVPTQPINIGAERIRIQTERASVEQRFTAQERTCYDKFLVNRCLNEFNVQRREAMSDLKRQEISINDQERKAKGEQQLLKIAERSSPEALQAAAEKRQAAVKEFNDRIAREKEGASSRASAAAEAQKSLAAQADRIEKNNAKLAARSSRQAEAAEQLKKSQERSQQAQERQDANAKRQQENRSPSASLPTPP
jgi:hypothetical protein